ncbi:hypothetical protein LMG24238_07162 [Paraburkholderia sediminicola]|uniref:Uncharacterized protein n=1 Tax=Paraburkholderia sediminicola TaxID=458836 RepID=A0A6J5CRN3_9BURK|nr:hypothetical protein [Paraburkholderia sediminicola]CAB3743898.1 hypothetical protein LMG24238_07162 [Paraburkholderia sediminicola]
MSAMLYELTANAARMCLPVALPAAAPEGWIDLLDHWQTLLGAAIGGVLGVAGALIVARSQRRREQRIAAGMVLPDLQQLDAAGQSLLHRLGPPPDANTPEQARAFFAAARVVDTLRLLAERRPSVFALHTPAIGQLSDLDARLYSHLFQCQMVHRQFEDAMASLKTVPSEPKGLELRHQRLYTDWALCAEHAALARHFLERLVFSPWPRWISNAWMKLRPDDLDDRSAYLLEKGEIRPPAATRKAD